jgi:dTDP-4-amino-4,6-dideoxygalactose transaminase
MRAMNVVVAASRADTRLALFGGTPVRRGGLAPWPHFDEAEIEGVARVLRSGKVNYWTGTECRAFEEEFAVHCQVEFAVSVFNGTVALELALHALGIGPGDDVVVSPRTFMASVSCIIMRGAVPVFADVDPVSQTITAESIRAVLTPRTKAIIAVHLAGWPCDMDPIVTLARERGLLVIEDCAQAHGATYKGRPVGSLGDVATFSFCQDKIMTTGGEGGMLVTNRRDVWERAWAYRDHGRNHAGAYACEHLPGFRWLFDSFGTNWRITEMQAAIGLAQLRNSLSTWVHRRRQNAAVLTECFRQWPALRVTEPPTHIYHAYYKYYCFIRPELLKDGWNHQKILMAIAAEGIPGLSGSCSEVYLEKAFDNAGWRPRHRLPVARELGETSLMFLVHPTLAPDEIADTCRVVEKVFAAASRTDRAGASYTSNPIATTVPESSAEGLGNLSAA